MKNYYDLLHELVNIEYQDEHALIKDFEFRTTKDNNIFLEKTLYTNQKEYEVYELNDEEYKKARFFIYAHLNIKEL